MDTPWKLIEGLDDRVPFLLFPMRIETRFMPVDSHMELWIRVFPDDIAVHTFEPGYSRDDIDAGKTYWREMWRALQEAKKEKTEENRERTRKRIEKGAVRRLTATRGGARSARIAKVTEPESLEVANEADLHFRQVPEGSLKPTSWSEAPRTEIMPDYFVFTGFSETKQEIFRMQGEAIKRPLYLGPDPQSSENQFQQERGRLTAPQSISWIYDFEQAVKAGMAIRVPLFPPHDLQGVKWLLVLGLRLSCKPDESEILLQDLIENHRYGLDSLSLVPQGTPTNNTEGTPSGYTVNATGEQAFAIEMDDNWHFKPEENALLKCDGQQLAEALGFDYKLLRHIDGYDASDVREAMLLNRALWSGTLGYFLEEMLGFPREKTEQVRGFFLNYVTGRGPLPALCVGAQPYGILLTSDFSQWKWPRQESASEDDFFKQLWEAMDRAEARWRSLLPKVAHIGASGDAFQDLLSTLGLEATSVEFYRRFGLGKEYLWNYEAFAPRPFSGRQMLEGFNTQAKVLLHELDYPFDPLPQLFNLAFLTQHEKITDPLVDDIPLEEPEILSEEKRLRTIYRIGTPKNPVDYIAWLAKCGYVGLRDQKFEDDNGKEAPIPRPLLYRLLRNSLLQALYDAAMSLYIDMNLVPPSARLEVELGNIQQDRTVTRWEFMDADISTVISGMSGLSIGEYLLTQEGLSRPKSWQLQETRLAISRLADLRLPTARLERIFVEHLDLCSYRLDAWQMGCFNWRLQRQRFPEEQMPSGRKQGIYLGAFGWAENLKAGYGLVPLSSQELQEVPASLHDLQHDGPLYKQPDNAGFIHGPSLNHAVAAAVLRNAYRTHFDPLHSQKMAVDLSSARVRTALAFLEGIRNGQELGALLGYQFERGLHDLHGNLGLDKYIPLFRQAFPLVADKITLDETNQQIETKEARNVLDGYALVEAAFFKDPPQDPPPDYPYPYGVDFGQTCDFQRNSRKEWNPA